MYNWTDRKYYLDFVFCVDATQSMDALWNWFRGFAHDFPMRVMEEMEDNDKVVYGMRIKVIAFRDFRYDKEPMIESEFFEMPVQTEQMRAFLQSIEPCGGGDCSENALEALALALKSDWKVLDREAGVLGRQVIILLTDAPYRELQENSTEPNYPEGMPRNLEELANWWECGLPYESSFEPRHSRLVVLGPKYSYDHFNAWNRTASLVLNRIEDDDSELEYIVSLLVGAI